MDHLYSYLMLYAYLILKSRYLVLPLKMIILMKLPRQLQISLKTLQFCLFNAPLLADQTFNGEDGA